MFPEKTSVENYVSFPKFDFKTGDESGGATSRELEEISITQWVYFHKFDGKAG